jgi:WD40 repeat protein
MVDLSGLQGSRVALDLSGRRWALAEDRALRWGEGEAQQGVETAPGGPVLALAWSSDGRTVLAGTDHYDVGAASWHDRTSLDGALAEAKRIGLPEPPLPEQVAVVAAAASADGRDLVVATRFLPTRRWGATDAYTGPPERVVALRCSLSGSWADTAPAVLLAGYAESRALAVGSRYLAAGGDTVRVWERESRDLVAELPHEYVARDLAFDAEGGRLAVLTATGALALWDVVTAERIASWPAHEGDGYAVAFHPSGDLLATGGQDGRLALWAPDSRLVHEERLEGWVQAIAFSGDGTRLAASTWARPPHLLVYEVVP